MNSVSSSAIQNGKLHDAQSESPKAYEIECDKPPYHKVNVNSLMNDTIGHNQFDRSTEKDRREEYSKEAYEDMRDIAKLAVSREINIKDRIINAGKEGGFAALDAAVDHPAVKIVTAAIKGAIDA
jgi:hypothetical protein